MAADDVRPLARWQPLTTTRRRMIQGVALIAAGTLFAKGTSAMSMNPFYQGISSYGVRVYVNGGSVKDRSSAEAAIAALMADAMKAGSSRGAPVDILVANDERLLEKQRLVLVGDVTITRASELLGDGDGWIVALAMHPFRGGQPAALLTTGGPLIFAARRLGGIDRSEQISNRIGESVRRLSGLG